MINILILLICLILAAFDQIIKWIVIKNLKPISNTSLIDGFLSLHYTENRGAAFGSFQNMRWFFIILTLVVIIFFTIAIIKNKIKNKFLLFAIILILSGGIGNLIDRIFLGYVVDYIQVSFFPPIFNFADACISIGAVLFIFYIIFLNKNDTLFYSGRKNDKEKN